MGAFSGATASGQVVLQSDQLRLEVTADGALKSLIAKPSGDEYAWGAAPGAIASIEQAGKVFPATGVSLAGDQLKVRFDGAGVTATYKVTVQSAYLAFELVAIEGGDVDRVAMMQLRIKRLPLLGPWINVVYDDRFGICLCAGNVATDAGMQQVDGYVELKAIAEKGVGLKGAVAILFGCSEPKTRFLDTMEIIERDFRLPSGARHRRSPMQQYSYLMCKSTPENIEQYLDLARRSGFRMLLFSYTTFTDGAGHFRFNAKFPNGMADLKGMADQIRKAGLKIGLHIHYSKAVKTDSYVTPVPDDRLHLIRKFTLAAPIDETATTITVREDPAGCTRDDGRRILKIGKELIAYRDYTTTPPFQFAGCERGHLKSASAAHAKGEAFGLLDVDDWNIFVRFDQNTDIQDEVAERIGKIVAESGPYDMVYFDGAEDVPDPAWYNVANAQYRVYRRFDREPVICETATMSHFSWHMMSRSNAYDVPGQYAKNFCHEISCRTAPSRERDFTRIDFGWFQGFGPSTQPDVLEYVISRGAAWDCPFSLQIEMERLAANPRGDDCLDVMKTWEDARIGGRLTDAHRRMLRTLDPKEYRFVNVWDARLSPQWMERWQKPTFDDQEHHLFINERGEYELVPIQEVHDVAGGRVRAYLFRRVASPDDIYALVWAVKGEGTLRLEVSPERLTLMRPFGKKLAVTAVGGRSAVPAGSRRYVLIRSATADQATEIFRKAEYGPARE